MRELIEPANRLIFSSLLVNFAIALIAGGAACRSVTSDRLSGPVVYCLIGIAGFIPEPITICFFIFHSAHPLNRWAAFVCSFTGACRSRRFVVHRGHSQRDQSL